VSGTLYIVPKDFWFSGTRVLADTAIVLVDARPYPTEFYDTNTTSYVLYTCIVHGRVRTTVSTQQYFMRLLTGC